MTLLRCTSRSLLVLWIVLVWSGLVATNVQAFVPSHRRHNLQSSRNVLGRQYATPPSDTNLLELPPSLATWWSEQASSGAAASSTSWGDPLSTLKTVVGSLPGLSSLPPEWHDLASLALTPWHVEIVVVVTVMSSLLYWLQLPEQYDQAPYEPGTTTYNPLKAQDFYQQRPGMVLKRILRLALLTGSFNVGLVWDWLVLGKLLRDDNFTALKAAEPQRAKTALRLCEQLGPTFIKLGQALSIRTDLIPEAYALELRSLQDAVPPFDSTTARQVLQQELRVQDLSTVFRSLSSEPVASASIGQVYKGTLASNPDQEVAVKVQRPGILAEIALDLYVLRLLTPLQTRFQNLVNGVATTPKELELAVALVDEWGRGFVAETDYRLEARNTQDFQVAMESRQLHAVCAPTVVADLVTDRVLVTEWVTGTRLDRDASPDVPRLCGVAINAYLTMLLDTGVLHCDPHPGTFCLFGCCTVNASNQYFTQLHWILGTETHSHSYYYSIKRLLVPRQLASYHGWKVVCVGLGHDLAGARQFAIRPAGIDCSH